jgi:hypothetical protein
MAFLTEQFQAQTKLKAKPELIAKWDFDMIIDGDKKIKPEVTKARLTATSLENACEKFTHFSKQEKQGIEDAASCMRKLVKDLEELAVWAKAYKVFCTKIRLKKRTQELQDFAKNRWGEDLSSMVFEQNLIDELMSNEGHTSFVEWLHTKGYYTNLEKKYVNTPFHGHREHGLKNRTHIVASKIQYAKRNGRKTETVGNIVYCSWELYESYLSYCKQKIEA